MNKTKEKRVREMGGRVTSVAEFLDLSPEEEFLIDFKIDLGEDIKRRRIAQGLTQAELARRAALSQPRLAALEAGGPSVSIDALLRVLHLLGASRRDVGVLIAA